MTPADRTLRVLLVEDNPGDAVLIRTSLETSRWDFDVSHVTCLADAIAAIAHERLDVVLLDLGLPDSSGNDTFASVHEVAPHLPVVVLTGIDDDTRADEALRAGAQDYLVKDGSSEDVVARAIRSAIERERLSASVRRHLQQRSALVELGRTALSGASTTELTQCAADLMASALEVEFGAVVDHDPVRHVLTLQASHGLDAVADLVLELPADGTSLAGTCVLTVAPILVTDLDRDDRDPSLRKRGVRSAVFVPIRDGDAAIGVLSALSRAAGSFEPGDIEFLEMVANMLSEARHRRASEDALLERMKERAALYEVTCALAENDRREPTAAAVARALVTGMSSPEHAVATVCIDGFVVSTQDESPRSALTAAIETSGVRRGELRVGYVTPCALLPEEQHMLDDAARIIGLGLEREDALQEARDREAFVTNLLTQVPGMTWTFDTSLRIRSAQGTRLAQLGLAEEDLVGKGLGEILAVDNAAAATAAHQEALEGTPTSYRYTAEDGTRWQAYVEPLRDPDGRTTGVIGSAIDITEAERTQRELVENQRRLTTILEQLPVGIWTTDEELRFTSVLGSVIDVIGQTPEELIGEDLRTYFGADPAGSASLRAHQAALDGDGSSAGFEWRGVAFQVRVEPLRDPLGKIVGTAGVALDVTERQRAERDLEASEERFRRMADHAPDIIFRTSVGTDSRFEYISPAVEQLTGFTVQECYDDPDLALRLLPPDDHEVVHRARVGEIGDEPVQLQFRRKDGGTVWLEVRFVPIGDADGQIVALEGIARDISQGKLAEEALREALTREQRAAHDLRQLDAMKNGFLTAISHELRTPLTAVVGFSALLEDRDRFDDARYHRLVSRLGANARRLERLLTDLLDVDRMTRATLEPQRAPTDVVELVGRMAEEFIDEGAAVRAHGGPLTAALDGPKVERIVENLLRNAAKHAPGEPVDVHVAGTADGVLIIVDDRGPGVPDDLKGAVFEPFRQGDTAASRVGGLGIGLSVVRTFAQLHGGRAWVEDREGGGASFRVLLPENGPSAPREQLGHLGLDELESRPGADHDLEVDDAVGIVEPDHVHPVDV